MNMRTTLIGALLLVACGCGKNHGTVAVQGRVRFDGGPPPAACAVIFAPLSTDERTRPGAANCAADGSFQAGSFASGDGLLPGRYRAMVRCLRDVGDAGRQAQSHVPVDFVPPEFDVPVDGKGPVRLDIDIRTGSPQP